MTVGLEIPWTKMIKPQLLEVKPGLLKLKQSPEEIHLNHNKDMHAGVLFSMSEMAGMGVVMILLDKMADHAFVVVKNVNIEFTSRAQGEITFIGLISDQRQDQIKQDFQAGKIVEEQIEVTAIDCNEKIVSKSIVTTFISPKRSQ